MSLRQDQECGWDENGFHVETVHFVIPKLDDSTNFPTHGSDGGMYYIIDFVQLFSVTIYFQKYPAPNVRNSESSNRNLKFDLPWQQLQLTTATGDRD